MPTFYDIARKTRNQLPYMQGYGGGVGGGRSTPPAGMGQHMIEADYFAPDISNEQYWYENADPESRYNSFADAIEATGGDPDMERKVALMNYQEAQKQRAQQQKIAMALMQEQRQRMAMAQSARQKQIDRNYYAEKDRRKEELLRQNSANTAIYRQGLLDSSNPGKYLSQFNGTPQERELFRLAMEDKARGDAYTEGQRDRAAMGNRFGLVGRAIDKGNTKEWNKYGIERGVFSPDYETNLTQRASDYNQKVVISHQHAEAAINRVKELRERATEAEKDGRDSVAEDLLTDADDVRWNAVKNGLITVEWVDRGGDAPVGEMKNLWSEDERERWPVNKQGEVVIFREPANTISTPLGPAPEPRSSVPRPTQLPRHPAPPRNRMTQEEIDAQEERGRQFREMQEAYREGGKSDEEKAKDKQDEIDEAVRVQDILGRRMEREADERLQYAIARTDPKNQGSATVAHQYRQNPGLQQEDIWLTDPNILAWKESLGNQRKGMDDPHNQYDYRAAILSGARPQDVGGGEWHWPSEFKEAWHPTRWQYAPDGSVSDTISGKTYATWQEASKAEPMYGPDPKKADPDRYESLPPASLVTPANTPAPASAPPLSPFSEVPTPPSQTTAAPRRLDYRKEWLTGLDREGWQRQVNLAAAKILRLRGDEEATVGSLSQLTREELHSLMLQAAAVASRDFYRE